MNYPIPPNILLLLKIAVASLFLGRAWQHLFWDAPFRSLIWDPVYMEAVVYTLSHYSWDEFVTSLKVDDAITRGIRYLGVFYLLCFFATVFVERWGRFARALLAIGSLSLLLLAFLYAKEKFYQPCEFFEYTLQWTSPLFLLYVLKKHHFTPLALTSLKLCVALTFVAHGLYALNVFPRPGHFVDMTMNILGVGEQGAVQFLEVAGTMDLLLAVGIFLPYKGSRYFLLYAAFWGLATAAARIVAFFEWSSALATMHQWWYETVMRLPHFLIPLVLWLVYRTAFRQKAWSTKPESPQVSEYSY